MRYDDKELLDELDEENKKETAKEILNKKKVTKFEMDMIFMDEEKDDKKEKDDKEEEKEGK